MLLDTLLNSLKKCDHKELLHLSVFDCGTPEIEGALKEAWDGPLTLTSQETNFTRTFSLNKAVEQCSVDQIFLCDVDMILPTDFVMRFHENVSDNKAWFPICFSLRKGQPPIISPDHGWWRDTGFGMAGFMKNTYNDLGGHDTNYITYGEEDLDLFKRTKRKKIKTVRENCIGFFHKWHQKTKFGVDVF